MVKIKFETFFRIFYEKKSSFSHFPVYFLTYLELSWSLTLKKRIKPYKNSKEIPRRKAIHAGKFALDHGIITCEKRLYLVLYDHDF